MDLSVQSIFYTLGCLLFSYIAWTYTKMLSLMRQENSSLRNAIKISLDQEDFSCLVRGGVLNVARADKYQSFTVMLMLQDIGFHVMEGEIASAQLGNDIYKGHNKILSN
jgi:hypothetical protein